MKSEKWKEGAPTGKTEACIVTGSLFLSGTKNQKSIQKYGIQVYLKISEFEYNMRNLSIKIWVSNEYA